MGRTIEQEVLTDASWFLSAVDEPARELEFVRVSKTSLDAAAFHDGRSRFEWAGDPMRIAIEKALDEPLADNDQCLNVILHSSFCGSTLLSRSLGQLDQVISYREPQVLIELTDRQIVPLKNDPLASLAIGQFQKIWQDDQTAILKPSNWANPLIQANLRDAPDARVILLSQDLVTYLIANLRGGKSRIRYSLNLLSRQMVASTEIRDEVTQIEQSELDGIDEVLRLLAIGYRCQIENLSAIAADHSADNILNLSLNELRVDFSSVLQRSAAFFRIDCRSEVLASIADEAIKTDAKSDSGLERQLDQEHRSNERILREFEQPLTETLSWYAMKSGWPRSR